ncbi:MAG: alpha/beta hydrolase [Gemmatimonadetes bacterium]|nr:MAG: alpha/beta hydrolase [Gemmatimonadota bacterium]
MTGWVVGLGALAMLGGLLALNHLALLVIRPVVHPPAATPADHGLTCEAVAFRSDGFTLRGWLLPCHTREQGPAGAAEGAEGGSPSSVPVVVLVHGWSANSGVMLPLAKPLVEAGYPVLLFDFRRHGMSDPAPYITARQYRDDLAAAVAWVRERLPGRPVVVVGHSMGGATAILAAADGTPIDGIVTIASPANLHDVTARFLRERGLPGGVLVHLLTPFWWPRAGMRFGRLTPERRVHEIAGLPMRVLAAEVDRRVPDDHPARLARASSEPPIVVPGTGHTDILSSPRTAAQVLGLLEVFRQPEDPVLY